MDFHQGSIDGIIWKPLRKYQDGRGWLCELFRHDEIPAEFYPAMAYISMTEAGVARGPHEHADQADYFCFLGPSNFKMYLWDNRANSATYLTRQVEVLGVDNPMVLIVPTGVVHAYKNIGSEPGIVFNCPNRLYKGPGRKGPVDEIRHEANKDTRFLLD